MNTRKCSSCPESNPKRFYVNKGGGPFKECMACYSRVARDRYRNKKIAEAATRGLEYVPGSYNLLNPKKKDMETHDLIYVRKEDKKIFHVKRIDNSSYSVKDPITGEKEIITSHFIRKQYECVSKFSKEARKKKLDFSFRMPSLQVQEKQLA